MTLGLTGRARRRTAATLVAAAVVLAAPGAQGATTWLQGRAFDQDLNPGGGGRDVNLGSGSTVRGVVAAQGFLTMSGLLPGAYDQICLGGASLVASCSQTKFISLTPAIDHETLLAFETDILDWRTQADIPGDGTLGQVFGVVRDTLGLPIPGADITLSPASGTLFILDIDGTIQTPGLTDSTGRFVVLDSTAGPITVTASILGVPVARAYGVTVDKETAALDLRPFHTIGGTAVNDAGAGLPGAVVAWDFDGSVTTVAGGGGAWSLSEIAAGLDQTVRGTAAGQVPAATFRASLAETPNPAAITLKFVSDASWAAIQAGFSITQSAGLGAIIGRVVDDTGAPMSGATITVDPAVGTVGYFGPGHTPNPALTATTSDGGFVVFNVPTGNVVLTAASATDQIRPAVAPAIAGTIAQGDLAAYSVQTVSGTVFDEAARTTPVGGALVQVFEFPTIATIVGADGTFTLNGVPKNTLISLHAAKNGFVDSYTFRRDSGPANSRTQDLFLPSDASVVQLYAERGLPFDRSRATVGITVRLSNGDGLVGQTVQVVPGSGGVGYVGPGNQKIPSETTIFGNVNILSIATGDASILAVDLRNDFFSIVQAPMAAGGVVVDELTAPCDASPGVLANLYPCDGAVFKAAAAPPTFQWEDDVASGLSFQVQFSADPSFTTIDFSSKNSSQKFIPARNWKPGKKKWKKILALGVGGSPVYWRVQQRQKSSGTPPVDTFSAPTLFIAP